MENTDDLKFSQTQIAADKKYRREWRIKMFHILIPFIIALAITPVVYRLALSNGIIDSVNGDPLKIHKKPVALLGGAAVVAAMAAGIFLAYSVKYIACGLELKKMLGVTAGGSLIFVMGLWDDMKTVNPKTRISAHLIAGIVILLMGIRVNFIPILWIAVPLTLFYIIGAVNAFNVTDGMDGLCAGISLVSCAGFFFLGLNSENMILMTLSGVLFMSLLGFLPYNFYPARIFLGDAGSGFLGFMLGTMAVMAASTPYKVVNFIVPILIISVPVFDMALAIVRRLIEKKPLFIGDREHIYDLLLKRGFSQPKVWCVMCGAQAVLVGIALFVSRIALS